MQQEEEEIMTIRLEETVLAAPSNSNEIPPNLSRQFRPRQGIRPCY
jgi:hypothetical protein